MAQIKRQAQFVARVSFPKQRAALNAPIAQGVALARLLNLDHLGTEICKLQRQHVAGNET
jgi:hypothetical protein